MKPENFTNFHSDNQLAHAWRASFGSCPPIGYILRHKFHLNWTRFHALPNSKRYATTEAEHRTILTRANILVGECFDEPNKLWVSTTQYEGSQWNNHDRVSRLEMSRAFSWVDPNEEPDDQINTIFYAARYEYQPSSLDWLFAEIADDQERAVIFSETEKTVFAPYDGGFDVVCFETQKIRYLENKFGSWMSDQSNKL